MAGEPSTRSPAAAEHRDQLRVRLNRIINRLAGRDDLLLTCVWDARPGTGRPNAPAWFDPKAALVTIDATAALCGADPADVNPLTPPGRRRHPVLIGLCAHEASHAHSTLWGDDFGSGLPPAVVSAAVLLEEPRIEARQLQRRPQDRPYLRAQSILFDLVAPAASQAASRWRAARAAVMVLARRDAGVLEPEDVEEVRSVLEDALGSDLAALEMLWREALALEDGDSDGLLDVAARWVDVLGDPPGDLSPAGCSIVAAASPIVGGPSPAAGSDHDSAAGGGASPDDGSGVEPDPLAAAVRKAFKLAAEAAHDEIEADVELSPVRPEDAEAAAGRRADIAAQLTARTKSAAVFHGYSDTGRSDALGPTRAPRPDERALARQIGEALRRAQFRERTMVRRPAAVPPGRLNGRDAMLGVAQRSMGSVVTAEPFRSTIRRHRPEPPMRMGIMVDVSGSMRWAEDIMATSAWAFAHAATYVHGKVATVAFGDSVQPVTRPGVPPNEVRTFTARGGWEDFSGGFAALDGALNLTMGDGVRLLIVVSDGHLVSAGQPKAARDAVARMVRNGGHVLWIDASAHTIVPAGAVTVDIGDDVTRIPAAIAAALATALRAS